MTRLLFGLILLFCNQTWAADGLACTFTWGIKARGISVGQVTDTIVMNATSVTASSDFKVNDVLSFFGVAGIKRRYQRSFVDNSIIRSEIREGRDYENVTWTLKKGVFTKTENDRKIESVPNTSSIIMDSTLFPYLSLLGMVEDIKKHAVLVLGKGSPYLATLKVETSNNTTTIFFKSDNKNGFVVLDGRGHPTSFEFTENNDTLVARVRSSLCKDNL